MAQLQGLGLVTSQEYDGARTVLSAAAWTYVAGFLSSFLQLLSGVRDAWAHRRDEVLASSSRVVEALRGTTTTGSGSSLAAMELGGAEALLAGAYDWQNRGFGRAPKFPPSMVLEFLLRHAARTGDGSDLLGADGLGFELRYRCRSADHRGASSDSHRRGIRHVIEVAVPDQDDVGLAHVGGAEP